MRGALANGKQIQVTRLSRGLTQEQLADLAGIDAKTVRKAEQGKRLDLETLTKLGFALETELNRLIVPGRSPPELEIRRRDVVLRWHRLWDAHDMEPYLALYHNDAILHLPGGPQIPFGGTFRGKSEIRRAHEIAWSTCRTEPVRQEDFSILVSDDAVILQGRKGVYLPDGNLVRLWSTHIFTFEDDLIVDLHVEYDTLSFARLLQFPPVDVPPEDNPETSR